MKLTLETEPFYRMLEVLAQGVSDRRHHLTTLRLEAEGGRLRVEEGQLAAEMDAMVWEQGRCALSAGRLKQAVRASLLEPTVVLELEHERLHVGAFLVPCVTECPPVLWQSASRLYFASALGTISSDSLPVGAVA